MVDPPIAFCEYLKLSSAGIRAASIPFNTITLESDRFICVRERVGEQNKAVIIDLEDANKVTRRPITADAAIMHPKENIIALRAARRLQVFNMETKQKLKSAIVSEDIVFMKWIDDSTIGLVGEAAVYDYTIKGPISFPRKVFDRHASLSGTQIINYRPSFDGKWLVLIGIGVNTRSDGFKVRGVMQLFSRERNTSHLIEGHAAAFAELKIDDQANPTKLFVYAVRTANSAKLYILEIDHQGPNTLFPQNVVDFFFPPEAPGDFPTGMQVSHRHGIIYVVTKYGFIHLYELESGAPVYMNRISAETILVTAEHKATHGIIGVNKVGQVLGVSVDDNKIIPYILGTLKNPELAFKLADRANLPGADHLYPHQYQRLFRSRTYREAAKMVANSPRGILRTPKIIEQLKQVPDRPGIPHPLLQYLSIVWERGDPNEHESWELARPVLALGREQPLEQWLREHKPGEEPPLWLPMHRVDDPSSLPSPSTRIEPQDRAFWDSRRPVHDLPHAPAPPDMQLHPGGTTFPGTRGIRATKWNEGYVTAQLETPHANKEVTGDIISTSMTCSEIINLLKSHGCADFTSRLDITACSEYPVSNGGFGDVYSGCLQGGTKIAIKIVRQYNPESTAEGKYQKYAAREIYNWSKCNHPNVARLMGLAKFRGRLAMISIWSENGTLPVYVTRNHSANRAWLSASICEGLAYLHENGIVHGDIKGANVLVSGNGTPMLIDFGNTSLADPSVKFTTTASLASFSLRWTAPEILVNSSPVSRLGDIYALGMTILEIITGAVPFSELPMEQTVMVAVLVKQITPARPEDQALLKNGDGDALWDLLLKTWSHKPELRPSAVEVRDFMRSLPSVRLPQPVANEESG